MPKLSGNTGTGVRHFLKGKKKHKVVSVIESLPVHPYPGPCRKPDKRKIGYMVSKG